MFGVALSVAQLARSLHVASRSGRGRRLPEPKKWGGFRWGGRLAP